MKTDTFSLVKKCLEKEREIILKAIEGAKRARDNSPSATESHHNTERNQNERMVAALEEKLIELDNLLRNLPKKIMATTASQKLWTYHEIEKDENKLKIIVVPEGYGGREIEGIKLVSVAAPIAESLLKK